METTNAKTLKELAKSVKLTAEYGAKTNVSSDDWRANANGYRCKLTYQGRSYSFDFWQGQGIRHDPEIEGVLDCLLSDANSGDMSFEDFRGELGYDPDSRKAEKLWKACQKVNTSMKRLLGDDYELFLYADRN